VRSVSLLIIVSLGVFARFAEAQVTFHGNLERTGVYDSAGPARLNEVKWAFKTEGPVIASPAVADGVVYVGSLDGFLYAVDQQTGAPKWKRRTGGPITSSPAVADGRVYFNCNDGNFYALKSDTGTVQWRFKTGGERRFQAPGIHGTRPKGQMMPDPFDIFTSSPAVDQGRVYFGSGDGNVYALDAATGALRWKFATKDVVHASPAVARGTVFVGSWDSYLYALDAATGAQKWRFKSGEDPTDHNQIGFQSSPAVVGDIVYVGCRDAHLYAIDATTGQKKWAISTYGSWVNTTPAVRDGFVYFATVDSQLFQAADAKTGKVRFKHRAKLGMFSSPALAGGRVYIGANNGRLYALNAASGELVGEFQTESAKQNLLKTLNPDGSPNRNGFRPHFYDFQDMYAIWMLQFSVGAIVSSPTVAGGVVFVGSTDGNLYALG
jgi:eukaryotic-like serine/threonine-protein kinase